jgi:hypothetical protein
MRGTKSTGGHLGSNPLVKRRPRGRGSRGRRVLGRSREEGRYTRPGPQAPLFCPPSGRPNLAHPESGGYDAYLFLNGGWPARSCRVQAFPAKRRLMRYFAPLVVVLLLSAAAVPQPATAQPNRAREGVQSGEVRSLDQILNGIRRERPGSLADVEGPNIGPDGEPHYRLKWVTPDGRVLMLDTDARTGRVLGVQGDDRGPGRGAAPPQRQDPRAAQGARRNLNPPPGDQYDFGAPGIRPPRSGPGTRRPVPEQNFAPGRQPEFGPPPQFRRNAPPPPEFRRGPPPPESRRGPPPQSRFDRGPGGFERRSGPPPGFRSGSSFGGGGAMNRGGPRPPRGQRSFR